MSFGRFNINDFRGRNHFDDEGIMQRYRIHLYDEFSTLEDPNGSWVKYIDAQAEIEKRDKEIAALKARIDRLFMEVM